MGDGPPEFPQGFSCPVVLGYAARESAAFRLRGSHPLRQDRSRVLRPGFRFLTPAPPCKEVTPRPTTPIEQRLQAVALDRFGLVRVRSPLLTESLDCFLFLGVLRWFTSPRWRSRSYVFAPERRGMTPAGFSHSEIPGSKPVCGSPRLIAAGHVLHRLSAPRHPPCTLRSLTIVKSCTLETSTLRFRCTAYPRYRPIGRARDGADCLNPYPFLDSLPFSTSRDSRLCAGACVAARRPAKGEITSGFAECWWS